MTRTFVQFPVELNDLRALCTYRLYLGSGDGSPDMAMRAWTPVAPPKALVSGAWYGDDIYNRAEEHSMTYGCLGTVYK